MDKEEILQYLQRDFPDTIRNDVKDYTSLKVQKVTGKEQNFIEIHFLKKETYFYIASKYLTEDDVELGEKVPESYGWPLDTKYYIRTPTDYQKFLPLIRKSYDGVQGDTQSIYDEFKNLLEEFIRQAEINVKYDSDKNSRFSTRYTEEVNYDRHSNSEAITISQHTFYCHLFTTGSYGPRNGEGSSQIPYINLDLGNSIWGNLRFTFEHFKIVSIRAVLWTKENKDFETPIDYSVKDLGLFDRNIANRAIKEFYNQYVNLNNSSTYSELLNNHYARERSQKMSIYSTILQQSKNLILRGAPGTGKTHLAKEMARELTGGNEEQIGFVQFHPSYDYTDFVEGLRPILDDKGQMAFLRQDGVFKAFCKTAKKAGQVGGEDNFDAVWDKYLDFITNSEDKEQMTPSTYLTVNSRQNLSINYITRSQGNTLPRQYVYELYKNPDYSQQTYYRHQGKHVLERLKDFGLTDYKAPTTTQTSDKKFVFIIDEINRGEISKIFGELFFAIDPGYRGEKGSVTTQYANMDDSSEAFYIPENVYIIGTMNDIDRSVDTFDFAMRRRFRFVEVKAEDRLDMWKGELSEEHMVEAKKRLTKLNQAIENVEELNPNYHIGPAYFLALPDLDYDYETLWQDYLAPLLEEYLRGTYEAEEKLKQLHQAYNLEGQADEIDG